MYDFDPLLLFVPSFDTIVSSFLPSPFIQIRQSTIYSYRYYLNTVTFGYSTAWWDWARWEREIDWYLQKTEEINLYHNSKQSLYLNVELLSCICFSILQDGIKWDKHSTRFHWSRICLDENIRGLKRISSLLVVQLLWLLSFFLLISILIQDSVSFLSKMFGLQLSDLDSFFTGPAFLPWQRYIIPSVTFFHILLV